MPHFGDFDFVLAAEKDVGVAITDNQTNCLTRSKMKRSASEMEMDPTYIVDEEMFKRSKLATALIQQPRQQSRGSPGYSFSTLTTGAASITIRKEHQYQSVMGGCSTWEQQQQQQPIMSPVVGLPSQSLAMMQQKALPDLSKELSILMPVLNDCSNSGVNQTNNKNLCCSVGSGSATSSVSCWKSSGNSDNPQSLPQSSFESCDSGWMGADDSYDLNAWKNLQNIRLNNINNFENTVPPPSLHTPPSSSSGYFDATAAPDTSINSSEIYTPDDFSSANNNSSSVTATGSTYNTDFPLPLESSNSFSDVNVKQDPCSSSSTWCETFIQQTQSFPQSQLQPQSKYQQSIMQNGGGRSGVCSTMSAESRVISKDCPYDFDCYRLGGPFFRIQRPGNPTSVVVPSGRTSTLTTFCNMLPRTASYIQ